MKAAIALWLVIACASIAHADVNLAVTCPGTPSGSTCRPHVYAIPTATTWVLSAGTWKQFGTLASTDPVQVCGNSVTPGSVSSESDGSPCSSWPDLPASQVPVPVVPGTNTLPLIWTPPTTNTDGNPVTITGYRIYWGTSPDALTQIVAVANVSQYELTKLPAGTVHVAVTAFGAGGVESAKSAVLSVPTKAPQSPAPNPPTGLKTVDTVAYDIVKATNKLTLAQVGTVPAGLACTSSAAAPAGYGIVDRANVVLLTGKTRPLVVVARCT